MRLLYAVHQFFPEFASGTEMFTLNLAQSMQRTGHSAEVLTHASRPDITWKNSKNLLLRSYAFQGVPVTAFHLKQPPWGFAQNLTTNTAVSDLATTILRRGRFDLIHFTHLMRNASLANQAIKRGVPYIITLTDYFPICYRHTLITSGGINCYGPNQGKTCVKACPFPEAGSLAYFKKRLHEAHRILSHASAVLSPSQYLASRIRREFSDIAIKVLPHGTSLAPRTAIAHKPGRPLVFGYLGSIQRLKGLHTLIRAFRMIENKNCFLKIYGRAFNAGDYVLELTRLSGGEKRIIFSGAYASKEELHTILSGIDVLCVPSEWPETYGMVIEEAFSAKIPVIASESGAFPERIKKGMNGFTFKPGDSKALYKRMRLFLDNPGLLKKLSRNIASYTTSDEEAFQYETLYRQILG